MWGTARDADHGAPRGRRGRRVLLLLTACAALALGAGLSRIEAKGEAAVDEPPRAVAPARGAAGAIASLSVVPADHSEPETLYRLHLIAPGDTLAAIAGRYGVAAATIAANNSLEPGSELFAGNALFIPSADGLLYTVLERDLTARLLGTRLGLREEELAPVMADGRGLAQGRTVLVPLAAARLAEIGRLLDPDARVDTATAQRLAGLSNAEPVMSSPTLLWPASGPLTQLIWSGHTGVDIAAAGGTPIWAPADGVVTFEGWTRFGGIAICTAHAGGLESCAYHAAATQVSVGDRVLRGQVIAIVGMSGLSTGPHVHWEVLRNGEHVNPLAQ